MKTKGIGTSAVVAIIVIIAIAGIGGYFALKGGEESPLTEFTSELMDAEGDFVSWAGELFSGDADILRVRLSGSAGYLTVTFEVNGDIPDSAYLGRNIGHWIFLDTDGDDSVEYLLSFDVLSDGWHVSLYSAVEDHSYIDENFPGTYSVGSRTVEIKVPLSSIGNPISLGWIAEGRWYDSTEQVLGRDYLPEGYLVTVT